MTENAGNKDAQSRYVVMCWCSDCTGIDYLGCHDGTTWTLGPFDTRKEAEAAGHKETDDCGPWRFELEVVRS